MHAAGVVRAQECTAFRRSGILVCPSVARAWPRQEMRRTTCDPPLRIAFIVAGAPGAYCGSCLRDHLLARWFHTRGDDVSLIPAYVPPQLEVADPDVRAVDHVVLGGISVYLLARFPWLRRAPRILYRWLDSPWLLRLVSGRQVSGSPEQLGPVAVSVLQGPSGPELPELESAARWVARELAPDVVVLPNLMLVSLAPLLRRHGVRSVVAIAAGEAPFIAALGHPYSGEVWRWIGRWSRELDAIVTFSRFYAQLLGKLAALEAPVFKVPLPVEIVTPARQEPEGAFRVLFLSRVVPEKGVDTLAEALAELTLPADRRLEWHIAGSGATADAPLVARAIHTVERRWGRGAVTVHGQVHREKKYCLLGSAHVWVLPSRVEDSQNVACLEALGAGTPVVVPASGWYPEVLERTGGGVLVRPGCSSTLSAVLAQMAAMPELCRVLGETGQRGVRMFHAVEVAGERFRSVLLRVARHLPR